MRLLVSVRNADEARIAEQGGAAIIDAKEPGRGSLGQVDADVLEQIRAVVPERHLLSVALGDVTTPDEVARAFATVTIPVRIVKLAFRGVADAGEVERLLREAVRRAESHVGRPRVVAVAYADHERAGTLVPQSLRAIAQGLGAAGLLIDTCIKDGRSLFDFMDVPALAAIGSLLAADELEFALAGGLGADRVGAAFEAGATIFGVRGAVCVAGRRTDAIVADRVRELAELIRHAMRGA